MLKDTVPTGFRFGRPLLGFLHVTHILLCEAHTLMSQEPGPPPNKATDHSSPMHHQRPTDPQAPHRQADRWSKDPSLHTDCDAEIKGLRTQIPGEGCTWGVRGAGG